MSGWMSVLLDSVSLHCLLQLLLGHSQMRKSNLILITDKQNAISVPPRNKNPVADALLRSY